MEISAYVPTTSASSYTERHRLRRYGATDLVEIALSDAVVEGNYPPSSEWPLHREIYKVRVDAEMVIHSHAPFATTMACLERSIPPFHYMVALSGGVNIPCLPTAPSAARLAQEIATTLSSRHACLLGHHGMVVVGESIEKAIWRAKELENVCEQYWRASRFASQLCFLKRDGTDC